MYIRDEIARRKLELLREDVREGTDYTKPWLDLDIEAYRSYKERETSILPKPYCDDIVDRIMMENVQGMSVLCLAGGGGQQSAVFSLLGANVTVLDLTPEQLESDELTARHYGYTVKTIQGDMRDLSMLLEAHYDRVYHPISTLFVPNLREVYREVARVLKPDGLYSADYAVPLLYMAENKGWDGKGHTLYITEPYREAEPNSNSGYPLLDVQAYLNVWDGAWRMRVKDGVKWFQFMTCPTHTDYGGHRWECGICQYPDGKLSGKCMHDPDNGWQEFKAVLGDPREFYGGNHDN